MTILADADLRHVDWVRRDEVAQAGAFLRRIGLAVDEVVGFQRGYLVEKALF